MQHLNQFYAQAASAGVSAFFATGDTGVANTDKQGTLDPYPTVNYPSSSPDVIAVGGTEIPVPQPALASYNPEEVWHDCCGSGGGGYSTISPSPRSSRPAASRIRAGCGPCPTCRTTLR